MANWRDDYKKKLGTFADAVKCIKSGDHVVSSVAVAMPSAEMYHAVLDRADKGEIENVRFYDGIRMKPSKFLDPNVMKNYWGKVNYCNSYGVPAAMKAMYRANMDDFWPGGSTDWALKVSDIVDVMMIMVTPPNDRGFCNFGLVNFITGDVIRWGREKGNLRTLIAEINDQMPVVYGDNWIHVSEFDYIVEKSSPIPEMGRPASTDIERTIGNYVQELIPDGANIQMGWGGISEAVIAGLDNKHDLGVISEMFPAGLNKLVENGIVTNKHKPYFTGKSIAAICVADPPMYEFLRENPLAECHPSSVTNDIAFLSKHPNLICVNGALAVDLQGQISAEGAGHMMISGVGGQLEFMQGARYSKGGKGVNVIASTRVTPEGKTVSAIVPAFEPGTPVSVPRTYSDYVVTEYGIAQLKYKTRIERAKALIAIAHPDFRAQLTKDLENMYYPKL